LWETALGRKDLQGDDIVAIHNASSGYFVRMVIDHPSTPLSLLNELARNATILQRVLLLASGRLRGAVFDDNFRRLTTEKNSSLETLFPLVRPFPLDQDLVARLVRSENFADRTIAAWSSSALAADLLALANDKSGVVRSVLSRSPGATQEVLAVLGRDESRSIRANISKRTDLSTSLAMQLAADPERDVRNHAISNPALTDDDLAELSRSPDEEIARRARRAMDRRAKRVGTSAI
jgi:hypothetical protein